MFAAHPDSKNGECKKVPLPAKFPILERKPRKSGDQEMGYFLLTHVALQNYLALFLGNCIKL
ncbi:hypothetical protein HJA86_36600 [Rhizobium bangladeshense]|nr:hypothetical protein [Rhizobium bangladeshense]